MSRSVLVLILLASCVRQAAAGEVRLEIAGGFVTLTASDAPLRQILAEWEKVGGTRIVNAERVAGPPVTLQLQRVPEQEAPAVLLRSVAGYLAAPRRAGMPGASQYESAMILATSAPAPRQPPPVTGVAGPPAFPRPAPIQPGIVPPDADGPPQLER